MLTTTRSPLRGLGFFEAMSTIRARHNLRRQSRAALYTSTTRVEAKSVKSSGSSPLSSGWPAR